MDRAAWLERRKEGVGASDVSTIFHLNRWKSSVNLWGIKTGQKDSFEGNEATRTGTLLEPHVLSLLAERTGYVLSDGMEFVRHRAWELGCRIQVNTDGHLAGPGLDYVAEAKTLGSEPRTVYLDHWIQVQTCIMATGADGGWLGVLYGPKDRQAWFNGWELSALLGFKCWYIPPCSTAQRIIEVGVFRWWQMVVNKQCPTERDITGGVRLMALHKEWQRSSMGKPVPEDWRTRTRIPRDVRI